MKATRRRSRRPIIAITLLITGLMLAGACGGKGGSSGSNVDLFKQGKGGFLGVDIRPKPKTPGQADAGLTPKRGGTVTYGLEAEDEGGYCLAEAQLDISGEQVARSVYDTLTFPGADEKYHPYLAKSVTHSPDYMTWTITPRDNVKFHDGSPLTAQVIKDNLDAYRGTFPARKPLLFLFVFKDIANTALQGNSVVVTMKRPWVDFDAFLYSQARLGIMGEAQLRSSASDCAKKMIGTGPFKLQQWIPNDHYTLTANPDYWRKDAKGNKLPYIDTLIYKPIPDTQTRLNALKAGSVNAMHTSSGNSVSQLRPMADKGQVNMITSVHDTEVAHFMFNTSKPPFDDVRMRRAVSYAINREKANNLVGAGVAPLAQGPFPPGSPGYTKTGYPTYDPAKAKQLVAELKKDGKPTTVQISQTPDAEVTRTVQLAQADLQKVGIKTTIVKVEQAKLINNAISGDFQVATWRNFGAVDPDELYVWWYGAGNPVNFGRFDDPVINCLLDVGRSHKDTTGCQKPGSAAVKADPAVAKVSPTSDTQIYQELNRRFADQAYNLWGAYSPWTIATKPDVHGIYGPPLPDGATPNYSLVNGHAVDGLWVGNGK